MRLHNTIETTCCIQKIFDRPRRALHSQRYGTPSADDPFVFSGPIRRRHGSYPFKPISVCIPRPAQAGFPPGQECLLSGPWGLPPPLQLQSPHPPNPPPLTPALTWPQRHLRTPAEMVEETMAVHKLFLQLLLLSALLIYYSGKAFRSTYCPF